LGGGEIRVYAGTGRCDAGVEDERYDCEDEVDIEERGNLLAACAVLDKVPVYGSRHRAHTNSGELGAHMDNHDYCHDHGQYVHKVVRYLEDEGVCDLNCPRIAARLYAGAATNVLLAHESAEWYRCLHTYCREVAEAHVGGWCVFCECGGYAAVYTKGAQRDGQAMERKTVRTMRQERVWTVSECDCN
jgi:hypothetical protein